MLSWLVHYYIDLEANLSARVETFEAIGLVLVDHSVWVIGSISDDVSIKSGLIGIHL